MYSQDKFYVTHSTSRWNLKSILEARSIQPLILKKKLKVFVKYSFNLTTRVLKPSTRVVEYLKKP